jgi:hypothetical protein
VGSLCSDSVSGKGVSDFNLGVVQTFLAALTDCWDSPSKPDGDLLWKANRVAQWEKGNVEVVGMHVNGKNSSLRELLIFTAGNPPEGQQ